MSRYLGMEGVDMPDHHCRGIYDSLRLHSFSLNATWRPPGLAQSFPPPCREDISGKAASDAVEALIGVFYEHLGEAGIHEWLAYLGLVRKPAEVRCVPLAHAQRGGWRLHE